MNPQVLYGILTSHWTSNVPKEKKIEREKGKESEQNKKSDIQIASLHNEVSILGYPFL